MPTWMERLLIIKRDTAMNHQLIKQGLLNRGAKIQGKEGIIHTIKKLGYLQIDTISVVERTHHITLWNRVLNYQKQHLWDLLNKEKRLFEWWAHGASFIPIENYRYWLPAMLNLEEQIKNPQQFADMRSWETYGARWMLKHPKVVKDVLREIKKRGPLSSKDFKSPQARKREGWWDWKPAKMALEILFNAGILMVSYREGFQRFYDLTERVLPANVDTTLPTEEERARFLLLLVVNALGIGKNKHFKDYLSFRSYGLNLPKLRDREERQKLIDRMIEEGDILQIAIENDKSQYYITKSDLKAIKKLGNNPPKDNHVNLLSPFDNLIIDRDRTLDMFNFNYTLEAYYPQAKRRYGYYVMPILFGNEFVGRLDPKFDRKNRILIIQSIYLEKKFQPSETFLLSLSDTLTSFAEFNGGSNIRINQTYPRKLKTSIQKLLRHKTK